MSLVGLVKNISLKALRSVVYDPKERMRDDFGMDHEVSLFGLTVRLVHKVIVHSVKIEVPIIVYVYASFAVHLLEGARTRCLIFSRW